MLRQQIHFLEALCHREAARAIAHNHDVIGIFHHGFRETRDVFDAAHGSNGACPVCGTMHDAGVEFDFALFIGQAAVPDGIVVGIIFDDRDDRHDGVERVPVFLENVHALVEGVDAIGAGDNEWALALGGKGEVRKRKRVPIRWRAAKELIRAGKGAASQRSKKEFAA